MAYLGWYDDNAKKPVEEKIREGLVRYRARFNVSPNVVLVSPSVTLLAVDGVQLKPTSYIRANNFWVGCE